MNEEVGHIYQIWAVSLISDPLEISAHIEAYSD